MSRPPQSLKEMGVVLLNPRAGRKLCSFVQAGSLLFASQMPFGEDGKNSPSPPGQALGRYEVDRAREAAKASESSTCSPRACGASADLDK